LWIQLADGVDATELQRRAEREKISFVSGSIFSSGDQFGNFIRLNAGVVWSDRIERALMVLGRLAEEITR
jgi:DNA-binding transcriptional MocR family regulator